MKKSKKDKDFLDLPQLVGGKEAFRSYIANNLRYPQKALENKIEGSVLVEFQVDDRGKVIDASVIKGLGYGCDEEALRLIKNADFAKTRKQGVRVKSNFKTKIHFQLAKAKSRSAVNYNYKYKQTSNTKENSTKTNSYNYTITKK